MKKLECGCEITDNGERYILHCKAHVKAPLHKVMKAHSEEVQTVICSNCGNQKISGMTCFQCGVSERIK